MKHPVLSLVAQTLVVQEKTEDAKFAFFWYYIGVAAFVLPCHWLDL